MITSLQNPLVKHLVKLRIDKAYRYAQQSVVIEGLKPLQEITPFIKKVFRMDTVPFKTLRGIEEWIVSEAVLKKISGMTSPEGILAEVKMPPFSSLEGARWIVAFDGINDPGNLGTLLRTALAFGWEGAYLLPNSCDPFNEKALRAARGAHFRLPLAFGTQEKLQQLAECHQLLPLVGEIEGTPIHQLKTRKGVLLVLGNEAHGPSPAIKDFCSKVTIPMQGEMESLNVAIAGSILMYMLKT